MRDELTPPESEEAGAPAEPETDWLQLANDAYSASTTFLDSYLRNEWQRSLEQWQGRHSADSKYMNDAYRGRSKLFRPKTRSAIRKNEASAATAYFATSDVVNIQPQDDSDPVQLVSAEIMNELVNYRLTKTLPWFITLVGAYQDAQVMGAVVSHQCWRYERGRKDQPDIELIPLENFRISPAAKWFDPINTSPYCIWLIPMYLYQVRERMLQGDDKAGLPPWHDVSEKELLAASKPYSDSTRLVREQRADIKTEEQLPSAFSIVWVRMVVLNHAGEDWMYYTIGAEHLLSDPVSLAAIYLHEERPFVMGIANLETHKIYPASVPAITRDIQSQINELANQRLDNVKFVLNKRYFIKRGAQVDLRSVTRNVPGSVTLMDNPESDVIVHSTPDVTASAFGEQDRLNLDFDDLVGGFSGSSVQSNRNLNETVGGMNMLAQTGNAISEYQLRLFSETWVEPVLRQLVKLEQAYETDSVILGIAGKKSQMMQKFGLNQVTDELLQSELTVRVNVGVGATNPQSQVERFFFGLNSLATLFGPEASERINMEEVVAEAFGKLGYKDGKRFFNFGEQENQRIQQLQQQVQELMDKLNRKMSPEMEAAQIRRLEAERSKLKVEGAAAALTVAQSAAMAPGVVTVADSILASSGWEDENGPSVAEVPAGVVPAPMSAQVVPIRP